MVMKPGIYQASFNSGELAPELHGNWGLKQFYSGLAFAENIEPVPQGGFRLLPRTRFRADLGLASAVGAARVIRFSVSRDASYIVLLTNLRARIYKAGVLVGDLVMPFTSADLSLVKAIQRQETMILFHPAYSPRRILRHASDTSWTTDTVAWVNVPLVDYGGTYANQDEVWTVRLTWTSAVTITGVGFILSVDGDDTTTITANSGSWSTTAADIKSALQALAAIDDAGMTVAVGSSGGLYQEFTVTFSGGTNSGQNFTLSGSVPIETNAALNTARKVKGKMGGEAVMSATRGWPRCATWYQDRLIMGGFEGKHSAWAASRTGEYFDLNTDLTNDAGAMLINLDTDGGETIIHLVQGAYLGIFTTEAMYHLTDRALKRNTPPNIVRAPEAIGCSERIAPVVQEGSVIYVNREETAVYGAQYDAVTTTFRASPLSLLSSHLIDGVIGADLQMPSTATDAARYLMPRDDGLMVVAPLIRNQDVSPFVRWDTDGDVIAAAVDGANRVFLIIDRMVAGQVRRFLEQWEEDLLFDAAITITNGAPTAAVTGLTMHEGASVWADADGWIVGPFTVAGGAITLPIAATTVTVGRWTAPVATLLPLPRDVGGNNVLKRPARVHTVQATVIDTTSIAVAANGGSAKDVPIARMGDPAGVPTPAYTGELVATGLTGFTREGQVTITQLRPGKLQVRDITRQARI